MSTKNSTEIAALGEKLCDYCFATRFTMPSNDKSCKGEWCADAYEEYLLSKGASAEVSPGENQAPKLLPCPICGSELKTHGPEDWTPSFYDPDSGGDPYAFYCTCGYGFDTNSYDYEEAVAKANRRV